MERAAGGSWTRRWAGQQRGSPRTRGAPSTLLHGCTCTCQSADLVCPHLLSAPEGDANSSIATACLPQRPLRDRPAALGNEAHTSPGQIRPRVPCTSSSQAHSAQRAPRCRVGQDRRCQRAFQAADVGPYRARGWRGDRCKAEPTPTPATAPPAKMSMSPNGTAVSSSCAAPTDGTGVPGTTKAAETETGATSSELTFAESAIVVPPGASTVTGIDRGGKAVPGASALTMTA
jgi:hypothetical protein